MKINILKESVPLRYLFMEFAPLQLHVFEMANLLIRLDSTGSPKLNLTFWNDYYTFMVQLTLKIKMNI